MAIESEYFTPAALAYLRTRGIDPDLAARYGVREDRGAIVWPTVDADGKPSPRRRALHGAGPKVLAVAGSSLGISWLAGRPSTVASAVLVTEGESDALSALTALAMVEPDAHGPAALAHRYLSGGAVASIPGTSCPAGRLVDELAGVGARECVLAFDCDPAGRKATEIVLS